MSRLPAAFKLGVALAMIVGTVLAPPTAVGWFIGDGAGAGGGGGAEPAAAGVSVEAAGLAVAVYPERGVGQCLAAGGAGELAWPWR